MWQLSTAQCWNPGKHLTSNGPLGYHLVWPKEKQKMSGEEGASYSAVAKVLALHMANPSSATSIPCGLTSPSRSEPETEPGKSPEDCQMWPPKNKNKNTQWEERDREDLRRTELIKLALTCQLKFKIDLGLIFLPETLN